MIKGIVKGVWLFCSYLFVPQRRPKQENTIESLGEIGKVRSDMQIDKIITDYVSAKDTDYAIMIDGEWGAGKSWYWENVLKRSRDGSLIRSVTI